MATSERTGSFQYPIVGVKTGYDQVKQKWPARKEIDQFMKDPKQALLFISALNTMQTRPMDHTLSFFQIAGIHGLPLRPWPRQGGPGRGSYCEHSNPGGRFCTWHRVYLLLIEQALHEIIMKFVDPKTPEDQSPVPLADRADWRQAAETWRLPYWDFALRRSYNKNSACIPEIAMFEGDPLKGSSGSTGPTIPTPLIPISANNPLYSFKFPLKGGEKLSDHGLTDMVRNGVTILPLSSQKRTVRHCDQYRAGDPKITRDWTEGIGSLDSLKAEFIEQTVDLRKNLRGNLKDTKAFPEFAMGTVSGNSLTRAPDLSSLHGLVHVTTGGWTSDRKNGNMSNVPAAAFDPIFFIYHCSIDRVFAMWQAGHPDTRNSNNWLPAADDVSPLIPFLDKSGRNYWISRDTRDLTKLGYTYEVLDEIKDYDDLAEVVDKLYSDDNLFRAPTRPGAPPSRGVVPTRPDEQIFPDYIVTASYQPSQVGGFVMKLFYKEHIIGTIVNFVNPIDAGCDNCEQHRQDETTLTSSTYISPKLRSLYESGVITQFNPRFIEELLKNELRWEVCSLEDPDDRIPLERLTSLKVGVSRREKAPRPAPPPSRGVSQQPTFRSPAQVVGQVPLREITAGKPGGLGEGEGF